MERFGLITDDLTMTSGVMLAKSGIRTVSYLSADHMPEAEEQETLIISTNSRNLPRARAQSRVREAYRALREHGVTRFTKRIDTTYRGGIGFEIDALLDEVGDDCSAIVVNTLPASHRILVGGYAIIDGQVLSETDVAQDVLSPVRESHIPTLLGTQSHYQVNEIHLDDVLAGRRSLAKALERTRRGGARIVVVDAISMAHVRMIAETLTALDIPMICVDSGALTLQTAISRGLGRHSELPRSPVCDIPLDQAPRRVLVVIGSATDVTKRQIKALAAEPGVAVVPLDPVCLLDNERRAATIRAGIAATREAFAIASNRVIVLQTGANFERLDLGALDQRCGLPRGTASHRLTGSIGAVVRALMSDPLISDEVCGMSMSGGDTLFSVLRALGADGIRFVDEIEPQTNLGVVVGGIHDGLPIVGKGGMIGDDATARRVVERLIVDDVVRERSSEAAR